VEEFAGGGEDDEADLGVAEDGELLGLLKQPPPPLGEGHLPRRQVVDPPYRYPLPLPGHRASLALLHRRRRRCSCQQSQEDERAREEMKW